VQSAVLPFLLGSRYCDTDKLSATAWSLFGNTPLGWARVQAIVDFVHSSTGIWAASGAISSGWPESATSKLDRMAMRPPGAHPRGDHLRSAGPGAPVRRRLRQRLHPDHRPGRVSQ
jgi:hypothetical protein